MQWLIHGHTHRPAVHELIANQQPAFRVVLGAWHTEGSMVKVTADDVELIHFPFKKPATLLISQPRNRFLALFPCYSLCPLKPRVVHHRSFKTHVFPQ